MGVVARLQHRHNYLLASPYFRPGQYGGEKGEHDYNTYIYNIHPTVGVPCFGSSCTPYCGPSHRPTSGQAHYNPTAGALLRVFYKEAEESVEEPRLKFNGTPLAGYTPLLRGPPMSRGETSGISPI